jgi:hypothetical protein
MKIKNIKAKVAAKVAKAVAKTASKIAKGKVKVAAKTGNCKGGKCCDGGKCKTCAVALALLVAATLCGCGTVTPSRSQTLTLKDCTINIYGSGNGMTNDVARVEIASQAMSIENSGTETQTATPQYTTDVKPDVDLNYNGPTKTASDGVGEIVDSVANAVSGDDCPNCKDK